MPPPIVPAPTTAARRIGMRGVSFGDAGDLGDFALGEEDVDQRLRLVREEALAEQLGFALACPRRTAA